MFGQERYGVRYRKGPRDFVKKQRAACSPLPYTLSTSRAARVGARRARKAHKSSENDSQRPKLAFLGGQGKTANKKEEVMEEIAKHAVPVAYRSKLRELFDALDKNRNGYLLVREVQLLGYAITGKVPSHAAATREMKRVLADCSAFHLIETLPSRADTWGDAGYKELEPEALRLSYPQFLLFSRSLATLPVPRFVQVIDTYLVKVQRAEPRISVEDLQRLNRLHAEKLQGLHGMGRPAAPNSSSPNHIH